MLDFINGGHLFFNLYRAGIFDEEVGCLHTSCKEAEKSQVFKITHSDALKFSYLAVRRPSPSV